MRSERRGRERGIARPPAAFWIACVVLFIWGGIGYAKSIWAEMEYKGYIRTTILSNPQMKQEEFLMRLEQGAGRIGVVLDPASVELDRGAQTVLSGGGIGLVKARIQVPTRVLVFSWQRPVALTVEP